MPTFPFSGECSTDSRKPLSQHYISLMTVFMLTHTGRVPSFQLLISFGHHHQPEISLPLYHFFISLKKAEEEGDRAAFSTANAFRMLPILANITIHLKITFYSFIKQSTSCRGDKEGAENKCTTVVHRDLTTHADKLDGKFKIKSGNRSMLEDKFACY